MRRIILTSPSPSAPVSVTPALFPAVGVGHRRLSAVGDGRSGLALRVIRRFAISDPPPRPDPRLYVAARATGLPRASQHCLRQLGVDLEGSLSRWQRTGAAVPRSVASLDARQPRQN